MLLLHVVQKELSVRLAAFYKVLLLLLFLHRVSLIAFFDFVRHLLALF
jgi:hypothetical protein